MGWKWNNIFLARRRGVAIGGWNNRVALKAGVLVLALALTGNGALAQQPPSDLTSKSLEELMNIEVTSVSKKEEKLFRTAAAVYVITQEEIRRSGLTSIPELLRLVPGLNVARVSGNLWAISSRGFNGILANKLLVMIDGRSIYAPEFAGVSWEFQDLLLEDIERIEVIRGPGGTIWGANAVNGIINIITKRAQNTQGGLVTAGGGTENRGFASSRYGGNIGNDAFYRVYAKYFDQSNFVNAAGSNTHDGRRMLQGGGRVDWMLSERDGLTLQGDIFHTDWEEGEFTLSIPSAPPVNSVGEISGWNMLGRWDHTFSDRSNTTFQIYFDHVARDLSIRKAKTDMFDLDFQHHIAVGQRQDIVWGLGYRRVTDRADDNVTRDIFNPATRSTNLFSSFIQDEITLAKDHLRLTLGSKFEHNDYSGVEVQPSIRLVWTPGNHNTLWGAISRAVRNPTRAEHDLHIEFVSAPGPGGMPTLLAFLGDGDFKSEELLAYELGYRIQPSKKLSFDIATFYNTYDRLRTTEAGKPFFDTGSQLPRLIVPLHFGNLMSGETYGLEASANWDVTAGWKLNGSYSLLRMNLHALAVSRDRKAGDEEGYSPRHQFQIHSFLQLPRNFDLNTSLYHVSRLIGLAVPSYTRLDARLGWQVVESVELSLGLQNLLDSRHAEFNSGNSGSPEIQVRRSAYGKMTWRF